ncbi:deca-heme c-type cytochrome [Shewanella benthica]|uniref:multiheme c-type cytochrome n=1 Tax=Shewanella benthica TaxID=43661 RepID=UPI001879C1C3|nr:multiheme c-type cytochrome [Shewanella benthica]MBE7215922.1 deca-heme c-type cytochrome [Shewanella benthica]MCL1063614.1 deca-heme c-type cytochrome [Shewanella benthica]
MSFHCLNLSLSSVLALVGVLTCAYSVQAADFVGTETCIDCHQTEYQDWQGSDHDMSMRHADVDSVRGNFNDFTLMHDDLANRFFTKGEQYWVKIAGNDGKLNDYQIKYTLGYDPLQQYMVEFEDGRVQLIPFAWDSRNQEDGGQRWFHLYPEQKVTDNFYWTNPGQNWNFMCADCHSTNLSKNYDSQSNRYDTQWSEINVACEACHGPASEHIAWAATDRQTTAIGFSRDLSKPVNNWRWAAHSKTAIADKPHASDQLQTCAQCHSRRTQISDDNPLVSQAFGDRYQLNLLDQNHYYDDGQVYDEVFVYGSFLQSKMHKNGVTCSNCHNPHSNKLLIEGNGLCAQCHKPTEFDVKSHHQHQVGSEGAQCINCHMPQTTYMQVDERRDHSFSIPNPSQTIKLNSPNACNQCHQDESAEWALQHTNKWFDADSEAEDKHFSYAFYGARLGDPNAGNTLSYIAQDIKQANIVRAAALERLQNYPGRNGVVAIVRATRSNDENIRLGAITAAKPYPIKDRWRLLSPALKDPVLAIRTAAASSLVNDWQELSKQQQSQLQPALDEYIKIQEFNADRGFARTNLGNTYQSLGQFKRAELYYLESIKIEPIFARAYVNLADLYRGQKKEQQALLILNQGMQAQPSDANLPFSYALALLRSKQDKQAIKYLQQATELAPENSRFWYVYGIALIPASPNKASTALNEAYQTSGNPQYLYALCEHLINTSSNTAQQCLTKLTPQVPNEVIEQLKAKL